MLNRLVTLGHRDWTGTERIIVDYGWLYWDRKYRLDWVGHKGKHWTGYCGKEQINYC